MTTFPEEEPWEDRIGSMLGALPPVDPPAGFIDAALDHRPLNAGRITGVLASAAAVAFVVAVATGSVGRAAVSPAVDELANRHNTVVQAGVLGQIQGEVDHRIDTPVAMPDGFERTSNVEAEDLRQAIYDRGDERVSVFVQQGRVAWDSLEESGLTTIDGLRAWRDDNRNITVIEASDRAVTIVGLPLAEVADVVARVPRSQPSIAERANAVVDAITTQLGFPPID